MKHWTEKQEEIESQFKKLYKANSTQPCKVRRKGRKSQKTENSNEELSRYAGSLTKEFLIKVRSIAFLHLPNLDLFVWYFVKYKILYVGHLLIIIWWFFLVGLLMSKVLHLGNLAALY